MLTKDWQEKKKRIPINISIDIFTTINRESDLILSYEIISIQQNLNILYSQIDWL